MSATKVLMAQEAAAAAEVVVFENRNGRAPRHGFKSTYVNHGCRCGPCCDANSQYRTNRVVGKGDPLYTFPLLAPQPFVDRAVCDDVGLMFSQVRRDELKAKGRVLEVSGADRVSGLGVGA